jgi:hypothetical protein
METLTLLLLRPYLARFPVGIYKVFVDGDNYVMVDGVDRIHHHKSRFVPYSSLLLELM